MQQFISVLQQTVHMDVNPVMVDKFALRHEGDWGLSDRLMAAWLLPQSIWQLIHMKCQDIVFLKNKIKIDVAPSHLG